LVTAWRLATWPTNLSPLSEKATTDGVVLFPSTLVITFGSPPSITDTQEFVVPKSIPIILLILNFSFYIAINLQLFKQLLSALYLTPVILKKFIYKLKCARSDECQEPGFSLLIQ
jgi:hypothetical protein